MYYRKFDDVFLISPSHAKMGIKIKPENTKAQFSLDWLFKKFDEINEEQLKTIFGNVHDRSVKTKKSATGKSTLAGGTVLNDNRSRYLLSDAFTHMGKTGGAGDAKNASTKELEDQLVMQGKYEELKKMPM